MRARVSRQCQKPRIPLRNTKSSMTRLGEKQTPQASIPRCAVAGDGLTDPQSVPALPIATGDVAQVACLRVERYGL